MSTFLESLQSSAVGQLISGSNHLVGAAVQIVHIAGIVLLLTSVLLVALRLLGLGLREQSVAEVEELARPFLWWGLAATVISGSLFFISTAVIYAPKWAFQLKLVLLVLAVLLQFGLIRRLVNHPASKAMTRGGAVASLVLWVSVGLAGRAIGFT
jgi:hypothetical protein